MIRQLAEAYRRQEYKLALETLNRIPPADVKIDPLAAAIAAHLTLRAGDETAARAALATFYGHLEREGEAVREAVRWLLFNIRQDAVIAIGEGDFVRLNGLAALASALLPELGRLLTTERSSPVQSPAPTLIPLAVPTGIPRFRRQVIVAASLRHYSENPASRPHEIGPLIATACAAYGWEAHFHGLRGFSAATVITEDYEALLTLAQERAADLVLIQGFQLDALPGDAMAAFVRRLRADRPGIRVVGLHLDPWDRTEWPHMRLASAHLDAWWSHFPSLSLWSEPAFLGKTIFVPFPHQGAGANTRRSPILTRRATLSFVGGIDHANWHRALWLAALKQVGIPVRVTLTNRVNDGLSALESYARYLRQLSQTGIALSFSMRTDGSRIVTGRVFEVLETGALLVQEQANDIDYFLTPNQHYLSFTTLGDLIALTKRLHTEPEQIDQIRQAGHTYYRATYADEKLIGYLDWRLFGGG